VVVSGSDTLLLRAPPRHAAADAIVGGHGAVLFMTSGPRATLAPTGDARAAAGRL